MAAIFCEEPIIAVYEGQREQDDLFGANAFLDCYHDLAYHVTDGYRIILETQSFYIFLSANGITKDRKSYTIDDLRRAGELIEPFTYHPNDKEHIWIEYPSTLFVGERLLKIEEAEGFYLLDFDDFKFKVVPHEFNESNFPSLCKKDHWSYHYVLGAERHINSKCSCGGEGELLLDFVCDYVVRCKKCKRSTLANMLACDAIRDWEEGYVECDLSDITIDSHKS
ncbi:MAG: hypothetical protein IJY43_06580 [Clostridia bacterium]|nr:hypothetical protein [Clostridia bacterium]